MTARNATRSVGRNRRTFDPSVPKKITPGLISTITAEAADTIRMTFDKRVFLNKTPGFRAGAGGAETVTSATAMSATEIELVFTGDVQGTDLIITEGDPGLRTVPGGFVPAGTYAVPTFP